jgi:hypothetical protein
MKPSNLSLIAGLIIICLIFAAVPASAESFEETYSEESYQYSGEYTALTTGISTTSNWNNIVFYDYEDNTKYTNLYFWTYEGIQIYSSEFHVRNNRFNIYTSNAKTTLIASGLCNWDINFNLLGAQTDSQFWANFDFIDNTKITNRVAYIYFDDYTPRITDHRSSVSFTSQPNTNAGRIGVSDNPNDALACKVAIGTYQTVLMVDWTNTVSGTYNEGYISNIKLKRDGLISNFSVYDSSGGLIRNDKSALDLDFDIIASEYSYLLINPINTEYTNILTTTESTVSVLASVKNIQDYSVIGDSTISFVSDTENITRTMPNGYDLFTLAKDTWYNVSATAAGFTAQQEYESNLWTGNSAIDVWMIPITEESNETVQMNWYVSERNSAGPGTLRLSNAVISINSKTLITDASGYASTILNRSGSISYTVKKDGYNTYSRAFTPNWETYTFPTIDEHITLLKMGESIGDVTPVATPDTRTTDQKAESAFNILFDNLESIVQLAVLVLIISLIGMIAGGSKKR